jgi:hypothetical protein
MKKLLMLVGMTLAAALVPAWAAEDATPGKAEPKPAQAQASAPEEMILRSPITVESTEYRARPCLSAEAQWQVREKAMKLLGRNGFAVIRNAAEEKLFLERLKQAGVVVYWTKAQPIKGEWLPDFSSGLKVVCWRDIFSADTLQINGAVQVSGSDIPRLDLQVLSVDADKNIQTWKALGVWIPRTARLAVPGPGKDEIWTADDKGRDVADGLQACLQVQARTIKPGDDITLAMSLRNVRPAGGEPITVWDNKFSNGYRADFYLVVMPDGQSCILRRAVQEAWRKNSPTPITIAPGKSWTLDGVRYDLNAKSLKSLGLDTSKEGIYTITGYYEAAGGQSAEEKNGLFWGGQIATPPVEVRVGEGDPAAMEPLLEINFMTSDSPKSGGEPRDPKNLARGAKAKLQLTKGREVYYTVHGKGLAQFQLDEKQVKDFQAALKTAGLSEQGEITLEPRDDRMPPLQKILETWVLCAAPDRGKDMEAEREKQRLAAEAARIEWEKKLTKLREMPANAIPVSEVRKWPEFAAAQVIDPYAGKPRFTAAQQDALRERLKAALVPYIGAAGAVGEPMSVPPEVRVWPAWTPLAAFSFRGPAGTADVWSAVAGQLGAQLTLKGATPTLKEPLTEWVRGLVKAVWGDELESQPPQMNENRAQWWFYWYADPTKGVNDRNALVQVTVRQEIAKQSGGEAIGAGVDAEAIRKEKEREEKLAAVRRAGGAALPEEAGQVTFTTVTIACGTGPEAFAKAWANRPVPLTERQAIARLACEVRNAEAGTELAEIAGKEGTRISKATRNANTWLLMVTTPADKLFDVRAVSVNAFTCETRQTGRQRCTEEALRRSDEFAPDKNVTLVEVAAWPEYAVVQKDAEAAARKKQAEYEEKAARIRAAYDKWWTEAKAKAAKALTAVRPDQAALAEKFFMDAGTLWYPKKGQYGEYAVLHADDPTLLETIRQYGHSFADPEKQGITVAWGQRKRGNSNRPEGIIYFSHSPDGLRLRALSITVPRAATDPAGKDREAWRKFALEGFVKLWGREPPGELQPEPPERTDEEYRNRKADEGRIRNPEWHRLVWLPMWKGVPLSEGLGATFEVVPSEGAWSMSWTLSDADGIEARKIQATLDAYPLTHSDREAIVAVVKNATVLAPDTPLDKGWVLPAAWSVVSPKSMLTYAAYHLPYTDEAALRALLPKADAGGDSVLTPARQVTVDPGGKEQYPPTIIGLVDPATGRILQVNQQRSGPRPVE